MGADPNAAWRKVHRLSAAFLALFILLHLSNHLALLAGQVAHRGTLEALRLVYRNPLAELILMISLVIQLVTGIRMALKRWTVADRHPVGLLQLMSGALIALFVSIHVSAVWVGRLVFGLDTDIQFAAAGFQAGLEWFFAPYYFFGVSAVFLHLACALWWRWPARSRKFVFCAVAGIGALIAALIVIHMAGDLEIAQEYLETY